MNLTRSGLEIIKRALETRVLTPQDLQTMAAVSAATVQLFLAGKPISNESFVALCKALNLDATLIGEESLVVGKPLPCWLDMFVTHFCFPLYVSHDGLTFIVRGDHIQPPITQPIAVKVNFDHTITLQLIERDAPRWLVTFEMPEEGGIFMQKLRKAVPRVRRSTKRVQTPG